MKIEMIVAACENNVIGKDNTLPWHLKGDLKHFKSVTQGKVLLMGRKTYESIGKPLPERINIVITSSPEKITEKYDNLFVVRSIEDGISTAKELGDTLVVIGGGVIYKEMLPHVDTLWLTKVHTKIDGGDTFFPWDYADFLSLRELSIHVKDGDNEHDYTIMNYGRVRDDS